LSTNGHRIRYRGWCPTEEREVAYSEIEKGYEIAKDQYVVLEKKDLETIKLKTTNTTDIKEFVDEKELDPIMIEKSYFIAPNNKNKNEKAYSLLVKVLTQTKKIALGKLCLEKKSMLCICYL
jgi:DNA end-binding protein Ku